MKIKFIKALDAEGSKGSFYFNGKLVATARYDQGKESYIFFDVNGGVVGAIKTKEISLPRDRAKAWEKLATTFGDFKEPGTTQAQPAAPAAEKPAASITKAGDSSFEDVDELWGKMVDGGYFTDEELQLVTDINGYSIETLNDCLYARLGYRDLAQMLGEDED